MSQFLFPFITMYVKQCIYNIKTTKKTLIINGHTFEIGDRSAS